jgi:leucyl/phenylalanyl-tRNA---protein transferase
MIPWLHGNAPFPAPETALEEPNGLLAAGGDLSPQRLLAAYHSGIFPWYSEGEPILWWSPDPRMVLFPDELTVSRSLGKTLRNSSYEVRFDSAFGRVIRACAQPRPGQSGTWITSAMRRAYKELHHLGYAHSVETWIDGELAGGLYGVALGRVFFGESMFSRRSNASKIALVALVNRLKQDDFTMIDCQVHTDHLQTLGAKSIPRAAFLRRLAELLHYPSAQGSWSPHGFMNEPCRS